MPPEPNRLFFALSPPQAVRRQVEKTAQWLHDSQKLGGRLLKPARYHITLFFLGDEVLPETEVAALLAAKAVEAPPFTLRLDQAGCFRNRQIPVWLGPGEMPQELEYLERKLREALAHLPKERQPHFKPHLTILREAAKSLETTAVEPIEWPVSEFVLIRSVLHEQPVRYEELGRFALSGKPLPPRQEQLGLL